MDADLVLDGGGVKGIGLVGAISALEASGVRFRRVAGTSAGAIVGSLVAAGMVGADLEHVMRRLDYRRFLDPAPLHRLPLVGRGLSMLIANGAHDGRFLARWLGGLLADLGVRTFGDLRLDDDDGVGDAPPERRYRLVVTAVDISRGMLVRLPWDYSRYGLDPDAQSVLDAVRASAAIPLVYEPMRLIDGSGRASLLVDGAILSSFPITIFDPPAGASLPAGASRSTPIVGIKLTARTDVRASHRAIRGPLDLVRALAGTMMSSHDHRPFEDVCTTDRTIFVDTASVSSVDFGIGADQREWLYSQGRAAAIQFLSTWTTDCGTTDRVPQAAAALALAS